MFANDLHLGRETIGMISADSQVATTSRGPPSSIDVYRQILKRCFQHGPCGYSHT